MRILNSCVVLQYSILQTGVCASRSSHTLSMLDCSYSTRHQRSFIFQLQIARTQWWECFAPCFNAQPDIFAIMNCCVVVLIAVSSDILAGSADSLYAMGRGLGLNPPPW